MVQCLETKQRWKRVLNLLCTGELDLQKLEIWLK
jgi:hypothetical protein